MRIDRRGDMGVAAMMLFVALILVASAAASIIIDTAIQVREQALQTGNDALAGVSTGFEVVQVTGEVDEGKITVLHIGLRLAPGSPDIDVNGVVISLNVASTSGSTSRELACGPWNTKIAGGRTEVIIDGLTAGPGDRVTMNIVPKVGFQTLIVITVPDVLVPGTAGLR